MIKCLQTEGNMDIRVVFCTIDKLEGAKEIARKVIDKKLAACVNIVPKIVLFISGRVKLLKMKSIF